MVHGRKSMNPSKAFVVVPCFNVKPRFNPEYWTELESFECVDWLFVDDGSIDNTR
jgi:hypothetical protein